MSNLKVKTKWQSRLTAAITDSATTAYVQDTAGYPTLPFQALLDNGQDDEEVINVTAVDVVAKSLTIARAQQGSTAVAHRANCLIHHCELMPFEVRNLITAKTTSATLTKNEAGIILASDGVTLTLPAVATSKGVRYVIKVIATHSAGVVVDGNSTELIDASQTKTSAAQYNLLDILCDGTKWYILSSIGTWN